MWKNKSFKRLWIGNAISELGGAFGTFCNGLLIYELTGSTLALGSMWLLYFSLSLIVQLFSGPYIDRWSRKWIMVIALWSRGVIFLIPLIAVSFDMLMPWHIYMVQIIVGLITPLYIPANRAILPTVVSKEHLAIANGYLDGTVRLMTFLAPIVAGLVIEYIGIHVTLSLVCIALLTSGLLVFFVEEKRTIQTIRGTWLEQFREGLHYFFKQRSIVWLSIFLAFVQFGVGVTMVTTIPYVTTELHGSYAVYGYFMAGFPLGYVIGTMAIGKIKLKSKRLVMLGALVVGGITYLNLAFTHSIVSAITTETIAGIAMAIFSAHNTTMFQQMVPNHLMGKLFFVRMLIIRGVLPFGVLVGGILSDVWGVRPLYVLIGSIICLTSLIGLIIPYFKFLEEQPEESAA